MSHFSAAEASEFRIKMHKRVMHTFGVLIP
jgi:hypothetical protein